MNYKRIFGLLGRVLVLESFLLLLPLLVSLIYKENCWSAFLITAGISLIVGFLLILLCKTPNHTIYSKEGIIIVALAWIAVSIIGSLPFFISGEIPNFIDALFETISGFTTTGASILDNVELMSKGLLFWRSFTNWIGGMGVLVFIVALLGKSSDRSIHILRAEMPGPTVDKIVPNAKNTAKILYTIYISLTLILVVLLLLGGMNLFDAIVHSFSTAGTGGFSSKIDSIAGFNNYIQWVIAIFMLIFGINFNLLYLFVIGKFFKAIKNTELWTYLGIVLTSIVLVCINIYPLVNNLGDCIRLSVFQVSSIISTTGFSTCDYNLWPTLAKSLLLIIMLIGACAGSTAGGMKVSRLVILFKSAKKQANHMLNPNSVEVIKLDGKKVENDTITNVLNYLTIYVFIIVITFILLSLGNNFSLETNFSAVIACFNNIGPGFDSVGPMVSYSAYSPLGKIILSFAMLLGRLEIFPLILILSPLTWKK